MTIKKQYTVERVGQMDFFDNYHIPYNNDDSVLVDNTDGVYHGNILEFKLNMNWIKININLNFGIGLIMFN